MRNGELLAGRYELAEVLGRGGMGEVREARDLRLGRPVAVKTLRPDLAGRPEVRRRFEAEARAAARLTHPHVVAVHDVGEEDGVPFIVMERVTGPGLEREMAAGPVDPVRAREVGTGILAALGAAHAAGIVHRDVKPANVLLAADGSVKVADFGIAKALDNPDADRSTAELDLTGDGQLIGTVAYMAPERVGGAPASVQSDLYSVGVILYEALSGTKPFAADTPMSLCWAIHQGDHEPVAAHRPGLDPQLVTVVERAMARRPEDRFATAAEMAAALAATGARPSSDSEPTVSVGHETRVLDHAPLPAAAPAATARGRAPWPVVLATLALCLLAAWFISGLGDDGEPARPAGSSATTAVPAGGIPAPLDDALSELEEVIR
ncbi:MAG TPA: serine/threonine-protein kinase [Acidimicrobiia bacterium]